jgi:TRAP-type C4-dicarboxylate transport system permease small subunit
MFANASSRYLLNRPYGWVEEVSTGMMLWITMLGMFLATRRRELITIRVVLRKLPENAQVVLKVVADLITALVMLHLAWLGFLYLMQFGGDQTAYLRIPKGFYTAALPLGALGVTVAVLLQIRGARAYVAEASQYDTVIVAEELDSVDEVEQPDGRSAGGERR